MIKVAKRKAAQVAAFLLLAIPQAASAGPSLMRYVQPWCTERGGQIDYRLETGKKVDCLTDEHAVEFARASRWESAIGGALYRAAETGKQPGIVLIIGEGDMTYAARLHKTSDMQVWTMPEQD